jgi:hypothetical protein
MRKKCSYVGSQQAFPKGRVIAQAVSCRLPTAETRVRAQVRLCEIFGGQIDNGAGFLRVFRFPLPIVIRQTAPHSSSIRAGTIGQLVADVSGGPTLTTPQGKKKAFPLVVYRCTVRDVESLLNS